MTARYIVGDTRDVTAAMPDESIDLVMTSPPFLALRSYLPDDHPDKHREIGSEPDPATFLGVLLELTAEWGRVLAPHGSICVELGDTYSGSGGAGGDYANDGLRTGQAKFSGSARRAGEWPLAKSVCGIPWLYTLSLAYGRNLLTGESSPAGQWIVRNVVAWCRPNPPVGALGDKFRPATSYMTIATRNPKRYFDLDAVRSTDLKNPQRRVAEGNNVKGADDSSFRFGQRVDSNPAGAPPLDYWVIPTQPYSGSHYATFPAALVEKPIEAMTPHRVCTVCGEPSRRIVDQDDGETLGWSECGCDGGDTRWRTGVVLDPFAGSGTTLMVATGHGRDAIGIDIDARNADLATDRVGPLLLTVEHHTPDPAT